MCRKQDAGSVSCRRLVVTKVQPNDCCLVWVRDWPSHWARVASDMTLQPTTSHAQAFQLAADFHFHAACSTSAKVKVSSSASILSLPR